MVAGAGGLVAACLGAGLLAWVQPPWVLVPVVLSVPAAVGAWAAWRWYDWTVVAGTAYVGAQVVAVAGGCLVFLGWVRTVATAGPGAGDTWPVDMAGVGASLALAACWILAVVLAGAGMVVQVRDREQACASAGEILEAGPRRAGRAA